MSGPLGGATHVAVSLPASHNMPVEVRPCAGMVSVQLGGLTVALTHHQARRLLGQLSRQMRGAAA